MDYSKQGYHEDPDESADGAPRETGMIATVEDLKRGG